MTCLSRGLVELSLRSQLADPLNVPGWRRILLLMGRLVLDAPRGEWHQSKVKSLQASTAIAFSARCALLFSLALLLSQKGSGNSDMTWTGIFFAKSFIWYNIGKAIHFFWGCLWLLWFPERVLYAHDSLILSLCLLPSPPKRYKLPELEETLDIRRDAPFYLADQDKMVQRDEVTCPRLHRSLIFDS